MEILNSQKVGYSNTVQGNAMSNELVDALIRYGNNPDGLPSLLYAAKKGDLETVKLFLEHGADLMTIDGLSYEPSRSGSGSGGYTALYYALQSKNLQLVEFLLNAGLDPNSFGNHGDPICNKVIESGDLESFRLLTKFGLRFDSQFYTTQEGHQHTDSWSSPAVRCIQQGSLNILKFILSNGGDLPEEMRSNEKLCELVACNSAPGRGKEKIECTKWMISVGMLNLKNTREFDIANSYPEFVEYLLDNNYISINQIFYGMNQYPIVYGAFHNPAMLRLVIERGADVNAKDAYGNTQLHIAATVSGPDQNYLESIKILLENGANPNLKDNMGRTPLSRVQDPKVKRLLVSYGAV